MSECWFPMEPSSVASAPRGPCVPSSAWTSPAAASPTAPGMHRITGLEVEVQGSAKLSFLAIYGGACLLDVPDSQYGKGLTLSRGTHRLTLRDAPLLRHPNRLSLQVSSGTVLSARVRCEVVDA